MVLDLIMTTVWFIISFIFISEAINVAAMYVLAKYYGLAPKVTFHKNIQMLQLEIFIEPNAKQYKYMTKVGHCSAMVVYAVLASIPFFSRLVTEFYLAMLAAYVFCEDDFRVSIDEEANFVEDEFINDENQKEGEDSNGEQD